MNPALTIMGLVFLAGAVIGGGLKAAGHQIPVLKTRGAQVRLALVGCVALLLGLLGERLFEPSQPRATGAPSDSATPSQPHATPPYATPPGTAGPVAARQPAAAFGCDGTDNSVAVAVHPAGSLVACVNASHTAIWNVESGRPPSQAKDLGTGALGATFDPAGTTLLTADSSCWKLFAGNRPWNQIGSSECGPDVSAAGVAYAPDGKSFATIPFAGGSTIRFWNTGSHKITNTYTADNGKAVRAIAYSPAGRYLATGSDDAHPYLWDLGSGQSTALTDDRGGHAEAVHAVAFSPDGTRLVTGSGDRTAKIWSVPDGKLLTSLDGQHDDSVKAVAFSPDGRTVVTGGEDHKAVVWDVATGKPVRTLAGSGGAVASLSFDRDGKILAAGCSDGKVVVWSLA